jgi:type IV pilus assembly protein PilE
MPVSLTRSRGFSLLELMIALGVAAIIATFALPAYRTHVAKARRVEAATALLRAAQFIETARMAQTADAAITPTLAAGYDQAPASGAPTYRLKVLAENVANGGYTIEAAPLANGAMRGDPCGVYFLDATGARGNRSDGDSTEGGGAEISADQSANCWASR